VGDKTVLHSRNGRRRVSRTCLEAIYVSVRRDYYNLNHLDTRGNYCICVSMRLALRVFF